MQIALRTEQVTQREERGDRYQPYLKSPTVQHWWTPRIADGNPAAGAVCASGIRDCNTQHVRRGSQGMRGTPLPICEYQMQKTITVQTLRA
jgi:hypothetical protein